MATFRRRKPRPQALPLGVISEGTLLAEDLLPEFLALAESVLLSRTDRAKVRAIRADWNRFQA